MKRHYPYFHDYPDLSGDESDAPDEADLWFLPGPLEQGPELTQPGPKPEPSEASLLNDWRRAEASMTAALARVAGQLGALDDRLRRGLPGWRHRLALIEAAELSWITQL